MLCSFGKAKDDAEEYVGSFETVYCLRRVRVEGDEVRILKGFQSDWQVKFCSNPPPPPF